MSNPFPSTLASPHALGESPRARATACQGSCFEDVPVQPCTTQPAEFLERPCPEPARSRSPQRRRPSPHPAGSTLPVRSAPELEFDSHTHTYTHTLRKEEVAQDHGKALLVPPLHWFFLVCFKGIHGPLVPPWTVSRRLGHCTPGNIANSQLDFSHDFFFFFNF